MLAIFGTFLDAAYHRQKVSPGGNYSRYATLRSMIRSSRSASSRSSLSIALRSLLAEHVAQPLTALGDRGLHELLVAVEPVTGGAAHRSHIVASGGDGEATGLSGRGDRPW